MKRSLSNPGRLLLAGALSLAASTAIAAVPASEASQLGTTLTEFGAIKAGNADGSIPTYTGGLTTAPAGFSPDDGHYVDPYKDEKPLYSIDSKNLSQYESLLSPGNRALLARYPANRIDVYPSHRTMAYPASVLQNTVKNATTATLSGKVEGDGVSGAASDGYPFAGIPFPIPKNGYEAMWNSNFRYSAAVTTGQSTSWLVGPDGSVSPLPGFNNVYMHPWYDVAGNLRSRTSDAYFALSVQLTSPPSSSGIQFLNFYLPSAAVGTQKVWIYTPGQRRVRAAPEFNYDVPLAAYGGVLTWDEIYGFVGRMDRFDFKLLGRREMLIPYNTFKLTSNTHAREVLLTHELDPSTIRWEKHRVWVVDSFRKPDARHIYSRRTFYIDEDSWCIVGSESYDSAGTLWRVANFITFPSYDTGGINNDTWNFNDLIKGNYFVINIGRADGFVRSHASSAGLAIHITPQSIGEGSVR